jgi:hypothetical protein
MGERTDMARLVVLSVIVLAGLSAVAGAAGNDPTTGQYFGSSDARLSTAIELAGPTKSLASLAQLLSARGQLQATVDREVEDDQIRIYLKRGSLRTVMWGLQELLNYRWESQTPAQQPDSPRNYSLKRDVREQKYEQRLLRRSLEESFAPLLALARYTSRSAEQWEAIKAEEGDRVPEDPLLRRGNLRSLASPGGHAALKLLTTLSPSQRESLVAEERLFLPWPAMTGQQHTLAEAIVSDPRKFGNGYGPHADALPPDKTARNVASSLELLHQLGLALTIRSNPTTGVIWAYCAGDPWNEDGLLEESSQRQELLPGRGRP